MSVCLKITIMFSNPIIITILVSLGISLIISILVGFFFYKFTKIDNQYLYSDIHEELYREIQRLKRDLNQIKEMKVEKDIRPSISPDEVFQASYEKKDFDHQTNQINQSISSKSKDLIIKGKKEEKKVEEKKVVKKEESLNIKPEGTVFTNLGVSEGKLVIISGNQPSYYREWEFQGQKYYEFYCDDSRLKKAINNRSAVIDLYCEKHPDSINPDDAIRVETIEYGLLDNDYNIKQKAIIKYLK